MVQELAREMVKLSRMVNDAANFLVRGKRRESQELHKSIGKVCESHELHKCKHHLLSFCQTTSLFSRQTRREGTGRRQDGQRVDQDLVAPCACDNTNAADAHAPPNGAIFKDLYYPPLPFCFLGPGPQWTPVWTVIITTACHCLSKKNEGGEGRRKREEREDGEEWKREGGKRRGCMVARMTHVILILLSSLVATAGAAKSKSGMDLIRVGMTLLLPP